jgi:hypothetical protein
VTRDHVAVAAILAALTGPMIAARGNTDPQSREPFASAPHDPPATSPSRRPTPAGRQEEHMKIRISTNAQRFEATLNDSPASRDLIAQLPQALDMRDHGGVEKTGRLKAPLSLEGQPSGADPDIGDIGYYAPGNDFVLYYGDQSYYAGIVILGHLDGDAAERIAQIDGSVAVHVTLAES